MPAKLTDELYKEKLVNSAYEPLESYQGSSVKILHKHRSCGHVWEVSPNNLQKIKTCPNCAINTKLSPKDYMTRMKDSKYEVLEDYISTDVKILHKHRSCGYVWKVSPHDLRQIISCPNCAVTRLTGCYLYYVFFPEINLCKVGVSGNWKHRLDKLTYSGKLNYEILGLEYFSTGIEAYLEEQKLLNKLNIYLCNLGLLNNGNTETFIWPN